MTARAWLIALGVLAVAPTARAGTTYQRFQKVFKANSCASNGTTHNSPCCSVDGWDTSFDEIRHPTCPTKFDILRVPYSCSADQVLGAGFPAAQNCCGCGPANLACPNVDDPQLMINDAIVPGSYTCDANDGQPGPEKCDGQSPPGASPVDQGCGDDEHKCNLGDSDPAPIRYSSGRVESNPIVLFKVTAPDDILFGYRLLYNSLNARAPAQRNTVGTVHEDHPVIHHSQEDTHFVGTGWLDNFGDRLYVTAPNTAATQISWAGQNGTVTFINKAGVWTSFSGTYELIDRGAAPADGLGRWVVRTTNAAAPRQIWAFEEFTYAPYGGGTTQRLGRLRRRAMLTSNLSDLTGRYGFTVTWTAAGTIDNATDTLGRILRFDYTNETECVQTDPNPPHACTATEIRSIRLSAVRYQPSTTATAVVVATLQTTAAPANTRLERVERPAIAGYTRFLYLDAASTATCVHCAGLLTDVIVPGDAAAATPAPSAPVMASEVVREHDDYGPGPSPSVLVGVHSKAPGREYAYEYSSTTTKQFDLTQDGGACATGNTCTTPGYLCRTVGQIAPHCYAADVMTHDTTTSLGTSHFTASSTSPAGGNSGAFSRSYTPTGAPRDLVDSSGTRTTYGHDTLGRIRCVVRDDNDTAAFADPTHPDTSACAGPATSYILRFDYTATTTTSTAPGPLGTVTVVETRDATTGLVTSRATTGQTRAIDGTAASETHTTTSTYDALGRVLVEDGPRVNTEAYDVTETTYYDAFDPAWPYNLGHLKSVTRYVGTAASHRALTTTFSEYDLFGTPHRSVAPGGEQEVTTVSADRMLWTLARADSAGTAVATTVVTMNPDGTERSERTSDGVCVTFEYQGTDGYLGVPTVTRRSNTACGVLPINRNSGEVEVRTYKQDDPDRLDSLVRMQDGVVMETQTGFTYDRDRRLTARATLDDPAPFTYAFSNVLPAGGAAPGGPGPGRWKTTITSDAFSRLTQVARALDASNQQTYGYGYPSTAAQWPTTITRGKNGVATTTSTFVYDDFGRLVEATVPEVGGVTRYEYDLGGHLRKQRVAAGTVEVVTSAYTTDALGRVTAIDHDLEHPIDCATAAAGTAIDDAELRYDDCAPGDAPAGATCSHALGRMTMSRATLQCGTTGAVVKRGRWYDYDAAGRISQIAFASQTGATIATPAVMTYSYDTAGRLAAVKSPLNDAFGTAFTRRASDGRVGGLTTTASTPVAIASNLAYRPFARITDLGTASTQTVTGGTRTLALHRNYRSDGELDGLAARFTGSAPTLDLMSQTIGYTPAGMIGVRDDGADAASSRSYGYDALARLTCELRDAGGAASCSAASANLAGLFGYGDGQAATQPADTRSTALIRSPAYTSAAAESYTYAGGSSRPLGITRTGGALTLSYDALGRRTADAQGTSQRTYTYLPGGQLATVSGTRGGTPYTVTMRYDVEGRPVTITDSAGPRYELFWDDDDRLVAAELPGTTTVRWHYHYLGSQLVAATREVVAGTTTVKRFWFVSDERGLIARVLDEAGATFWQARWDASAVRTLVGTPQPNMWVPFGLPGQVILEGTEVTGDGSGARPAIALNQLRAYDPLLGSFLQPDPMDQTTRRLAEGYLYGRGDSVNNADPTGSETLPEVRKWVDEHWHVHLDPRECGHNVQRSKRRLSQILSDHDLVARIIFLFDHCPYGRCATNEGGIMGRLRYTLLNGTYRCAQDGLPIDYDIDFVKPDKTRVKFRARFAIDPNTGTLIHGDDGKGEANAETFNLGDWIDDRVVVFSERPAECWARDILHEALHQLVRHDEIMGEKGLEKCVSCPGDKKSK